MMTTRRRCLTRIVQARQWYASTVGPCSHSDTRTHLRTHTHTHARGIWLRARCNGGLSQEVEWTPLSVCEESPFTHSSTVYFHGGTALSAGRRTFVRATLACWLFMLNRLTHTLLIDWNSVLFFSERVCLLNFFLDFFYC